MPSFAHRFCQLPEVSVAPDVTNFFGKRIDCFTGLGIKLLFIFDNVRNPLKAAENKLRREKLDECERKLQEMLTDDDIPYDDKAFLKVKKSCCYPREDVVAD